MDDVGAGDEGHGTGAVVTVPDRLGAGTDRPPRGGGARVAAIVAAGLVVVAVTVGLVGLPGPIGRSGYLELRAAADRANAVTLTDCTGSETRLNDVSIDVVRGRLHSVGPVANIEPTAADATLFLEGTRFTWTDVMCDHG